MDAMRLFFTSASEIASYSACDDKTFMRAARRRMCSLLYIRLLGIETTGPFPLSTLFSPSDIALHEYSDDLINAGIAGINAKRR